MVATTSHVRRATCLLAFAVFAAFAAAQSPAHAGTGVFSPAVSRALVRGFGSLPAFMSPAAVNSKTPVLFVADENTDAVYLLDANHINALPVGKITSGIHLPQSLAVDRKGVLYVANLNAITVYLPGALTPFRTIKAGAGTPSRLAIGADGTLVVSYTPRLFSNGTVLIFDKGSLTPTRRILIPLGQGVDAVSLDGVAIDSSENAYAAVRRYPHGQAQVLKFAPGSTQGADLGLTPGILGGFDARGNFYIGFGGQISVYGPGSTRPFRTIASGLVSLGSFTVAADGTIFAPNTAHLVNGEGAPGDVVEFAPNGSVPIARRAAADDVNPFATALRP